ncbi:histone deacetylase 11 isoform X6 [Macaca fascicularis]|uniref:histone deacetylase 11 isoform X6 n=2 Tax=Macaca fascicularis TaxID=9541 RepID=UPI003D15ABE7
MLHTTQLYQHVPETRWPIVYSPRYNITFMGLEKLHPFDAGKWGKVINFLKEEKLLSDSMLVEAREASEEDLLVVHTRRYLNELKGVASTTAPATVAGASVPMRTSHSPSSFCLSVWRASPGLPSLILMPIRAMGMSETSWTTSVCTSWMSTTATSTPGTALPSRPSGGRWSWSGAQRMMNTWIRWRGTSRSPSRSTCPTWWCTMQAPTSSRGTDLGGCPSAQRAL